MVLEHIVVAGKNSIQVGSIASGVYIAIIVLENGGREVHKLIKPGFIAKEYLEGKHQLFIPPIHVFLFLSFIYFGLGFLLDTDNHIGYLYW
ncbi:MAG: DUF3667 domain-containing protein [Crocinitomicaceae bacterium]|nr:DUF3667 domain-containing protein [Crocinitomicaceae bacterium]